MTRDRKGRDRRRVARSSKPVEDNQFRVFPALPSTSAGEPVRQPTPEWEASNGVRAAPLQPNGLGAKADSETRRSKRSRNALKNTFKPSQGLQNLLNSWLFWCVTAAIVFGGSGFMAIALLLRLPALPNCPAIFWPTASASLRIYCAQLAANKETVDDLLSAIELVNDLPNDHPMREEINRNIEQWSQQVLDLCDNTFQAGKLDQAIEMARKVPSNVPAYRLVEERIDRWKATWAEAEEIYKKAEAELRKQNWPQAFREAVRLLDVGNNYWATTKYEELTLLMKSAREDGNKLGKAYNSAEQGGLENLLQAIKLAQSIDPKSHVYRDAQEALRKFSSKLMDLAEETLEKRDLQAAISIVRQIPESVNLKDEVQDFIDLARAEAQSWPDTVEGIESAITAAQKINRKRPLYSKAQRLISQWQQSLEGLAYLERARALAKGGVISDLKEAISQAQLVSSSKPRWDEAQAEIKRWRGQIETQEDRPYLDKAEMLARSGSVSALQAAINQANMIGGGRALYEEAQNKIQGWNREIQTQEDRPALEMAMQLARSGNTGSLQAAINEARKISSGRALYEEAQDKIQEWKWQQQQQEDQPYLDRARQMADMGRLSDAIAAAERIQPGRALYESAQEAIKTWRDEIRAKQDIEDAYRYANSGNPETLASAIRTANQVSDSSLLRAEADGLIEQWSQQILAIARERAASDLPGAIEIAQKIPSYAGAFSAAQRQIESWQQQLNPAPAPSAVAPAPVPSAAPAPPPPAAP
ncbi:chromosome segregation ATPase [Microcoleus sp. FACHB-672]|uniref:chromosome segregation ATPase n=1 Tax=Microcoleus sp. FACHB-672 TaxID=2692825 RepID=UPI0016826A75|nr:chromosome segregation ATPase [Microcoleus sp. FACHB-672]MBD2042459.1 chromosome segregation ATPase [Microcoleus sp. FACHB-672]